MEFDDEFDGEEEIANASSSHRLVFNIVVVVFIVGKEKKFAEGKTRVKKARGGGARTIDKGNRKKTGSERREEKAVRARVGRRAATTAGAAAAAAAAADCQPGRPAAFEHRFDLNDVVDEWLNLDLAGFRLLVNLGIVKLTKSRVGMGDTEARLQT